MHLPLSFTDTMIGVLLVMFALTVLFRIPLSGKMSDVPMIRQGPRVRRNMVRRGRKSRLDDDD